MKNSKVVIPVVVGLIIVIVGIAAMSNQESNIIEVEDVLDKELRPNEENTPEIQEKLEEIEKINLENEYSPKPREWLTSGPFQIDRSEYVLGEKIFLVIGGLNEDEKGQVAFLRPLNMTHQSVYLTVPFDGTTKSGFNYYVEPQLSKNRGFCTADDFVGNWRVVFRGTDYPDLQFRITEDILPGDEEDYQPVC
ncbi:MAG: hypothetical protein OEM77_06410 [Nitrosopumilus sp.]|nr:hypothetical protein [Nitrosopumilus sp.]MDH3737293.1 hypothetical protein [Nitrosopumilus sp.]MDH3822724.1 hypothetical protein [Nitrosopumilus sp.]MDH3834240.1 hypothetical protein [Nitrosopumilus sp.]